MACLRRCVCQKAVRPQSEENDWGRRGLGSDTALVSSLSRLKDRATTIVLEGTVLKYSRSDVVWRLVCLKGDAIHRLSALRNGLYRSGVSGLQKHMTIPDLDHRGHTRAVDRGDRYRLP